MDPLVALDVARAQQAEYVEVLQALVTIESGSFTPDGVNRVADVVETSMRSDGWEVARRAHDPVGDEPQLGDLLVGTLRGRGTARVLLVGHTDTVFEEGTVAQRPFEVRDRVARGPGVVDMKGGLLLGLLAARIVRDHASDAFERLTYVCNPDEEIGSPFSMPAIRELAGEHDAAFVLEPARANGAVVSARNGIAGFTIVVSGRAAHAGVEPEKGAHALLEAAHKLIAVQALHRRTPAVTVNVGVVRGGTRPNVVPDRCELEVDVRAATAGELAEIEEEIRRICGRSDVDGTHVEVRRNALCPPMEKDTGVTGILDLAVASAKELGFELQDVATGGASDANTTHQLTPTLDGLGPVGGGAHGDDEWLDLGSVVERTALLALLVSRVPSRREPVAPAAGHGST